MSGGGGGAGGEGEGGTGAGGGSGGAGAGGAGAGGGAGGGAGAGDGKGQFVPRERLAEEAKKRRDAEKRATDAEERAKKADKAEERAAKLQADLAAATELRDLARAGVVDDDHVDALRIAYGKIDESDRPASLVEFAATMRDAADRPKILAGFYAGGDGGSGGGGRPPPVTPPQRRAPPAESAGWAAEMARLTKEFQADPTNAAKRKAFQDHKAKKP